MRKLIHVSVLLVAAVLTPGATAQPPGPVATPTYSPYLNLLRTGAPPAVNYYGLVRPEQNYRQTVQGIQSAVSTNQRTLADLTSGNLAPTGVQAQFLNHMGFFQTHRSGNFGTGAQGVSPTAARR